MSSLSHHTALLVGALILASCGAAPTYAEVQATALATGCWPDTHPTPRAVTITPQPSAALADATPLPGQPTSTALPTTTPYPRCAPALGETAVAWATAVPNPPAFPTMEPRRWVGGSHQQSVIELPQTILGIDMATHPTEGWPAVASVVWSGNADPDRIFVSVYQPESGRWGLARQVDIGAARVGRYSRSVAVAVTPQRAVHAVWGMSDPDFQDGDPPSGIWAASSADMGRSWSQPTRIASSCRQVADLAAAPDGTLAALLICEAGPRAGVPTLVLRGPDGRWRAPEPLGAPAWLYSEGALLISDAPGGALLHALVLAGEGSPTAYLIRRPLTGAGATQVRAIPVDRPDGDPTGVRMWHVRGLVVDRARPGAPPLLLFTWTDAERGAAYALRSTDGGATWRRPELIASAPGGQQLAYVAPAYDPSADRLVAIWTCCGDDTWEERGTTHYAAWSDPDGGVWTPLTSPASPGGPVPLALGGHSVAASVTAQAANMRMAWLAWVERRRTVVVRTVDLNQIIPVDQYALPTPAAEVRP